MSQPLKIDIVALDAIGPVDRAAGDGVGTQTLVVFMGADAAFGSTTRALLKAEGVALIERAAAIGKFKGKTLSALDIITPAGMAADRLLVIGVGAGEKGLIAKEPKSDEEKHPAPNEDDLTMLGGFTRGKLAAGTTATIVFDLPWPPADPAAALGDFLLGARLRDFKFDTYKTKKGEDGADDSALHLRVATETPRATEAAVAARASIAAGVITARTLVNEPANVLFPEEVVNRLQKLEKLGVEIEILDETRMKALGMNALLGVGLGSVKESRVAIMRWRGTTSDEAPVAFVGKGVCFDTGGISIKPAGGMEDMKGDMAGAACVIGLMEALAGRKAKVHAVGAVGLVENAIGPEAQRPGDIVKSASGQTIEIINTDAEGRLVLADVLWYVQENYKPKLIVDLATLTGAILVALGQDHAGLFSNDDALSEQLHAVGLATGEKVWRLPLGPVYDKLIDSKFADMKNTGGRHGGSITAAQFLQRFITGKTPWAHLDIAGTGMSSPSSEINQSWGSGWGVRLLDRFVAKYHEV
jgi:leucyl aminopeptidase